MAAARFLAIDLGAESGRGIVGEVDESKGGQLTLHEAHRFPNRPVRLFGHLHWNPLDLHGHIVEGIGAARQAGSLAGIGIDTWAVDYALLGPDDALLGVPYHYRDTRTDGVMEAAFDVMPQAKIYERTGIQFLPFNTLYQLIAARRDMPDCLDAARSLLMMGEYFTFLLTGEKMGEFTNASTTQLLDPRRRTWAPELFDAFHLPQRIMPPIVEPGTVVGRLLPDVADETGAGKTPVIAPAVHDTGSAVAAVPSEGDDWCYLSSGTWSLLGVEVSEPVINSVSRKYDLTNEGGVAGTFRLLKNVMGLWILQECRRQWAGSAGSSGGAPDAGDSAAAGKRGAAAVSAADLSYEGLAARAERAAPFRTLIDPDDLRFLSPGDMTEKIRAYARETGQPAPEDVGALVRCILESLALKYRYVVERLEEATGKEIRVIHVVGGGSQNRLLNQFTANATGRAVCAGPIEATATGNILVQAMASGVVDGLDAARSLVRRGTSLTWYEPQETAAWEEAYERLVHISRAWVW